jgi:hypothetical protein
LKEADMAEKLDSRAGQIGKLMAAVSVLGVSLGMIQATNAASEDTQAGTAQSLKGESLQDKHTQFLKGQSVQDKHTQFLKTESLQGKHQNQLKFDSQQHKTSTQIKTDSNQIKNGSEAVQLNPQPEPPKPTTGNTPH